MKPRFYNPARTRPDEDSGLTVPYAPAKRRVPRWRWYLILLVVSSPLLFFAARGIYSLAVISAPGNVMLEQYELRAATAGFVDALNVRIGELIDAGDALVMLDDPGLAEKRLRLERELLSLKKTVPEGAPELLEVLRKQLDLARRMLAERRAAQRVMAELFAAGAATVAERDQARARVIEAEANLHRAEADLAQALQRARPVEDAAYANAVERIETELQLIDFRAARLDQFSDYAGRVIDIFVSEGEFVDEGTPLLLIGRLTKPDIIAYLEPRHAGRVKAGTTATVRFPDGKTLSAYVVREPALTKRMPAELVTTFGQRPMSVLLTLQPEQRWPPGSLIHGLPLTIRFHYRWEQHLPSRTAETQELAMP